MKHSADSPPTPDAWTPVAHGRPVDEAGPETEQPGAARGIPAEPGRWFDSIPWRSVIGPALVVVLLVVGALIGAALGRSASPATATPTVSASPAFAMEPPVQVGDLVRGDVTESSGPAPGNQRIVRADYSDGANKVIFVMTWPEDDAQAYVADAGVENLVDSADGTLCGTSVDTSLPACGRVTEGTGLLLLAVTEQATPEVADLLAEFENAVTGAG